MNPCYLMVAKRAAHHCEYCGAPEAVFNFPFEVEHVVPPGCGGTDDESNLALACRSCNVYKSDSLVRIRSRGKFGSSAFPPSAGQLEGALRCRRDRRHVRKNARWPRNNFPVANELPRPNRGPQAMDGIKNVPPILSFREAPLALRRALITLQALHDYRRNY